MGSLSTSRILLIGLAAVVLASFLPLWASGYILGLLTLAYYFGVFAMAWDLLFGFAGEGNFGPTFLIGTRAYTAGILDNLYQPPIWIYYRVHPWDSFYRRADRIRCRPARSAS